MSEQEMQLVVFALKSGNNLCEYGVPITQVQEIIRLTTPTRIPNAPGFVEGVINLRGKVIPVIDLKNRFDLKYGEHTDNTRIIVVDIGGHTVGIIVDEVTEVLRLSATDIEPPPSIIEGITTEYLRGVGKVGDRLLVLLDIQKVLGDSEAQELREVAM
jgi:purine-binding chemotaxis protein CheW